MAPFPPAPRPTTDFFLRLLFNMIFCNLAEILSKNSSDFRGWEVLSSHESAGVSLKLLDALSYSAILIVICICQKCVVKTSSEQELAYYKNALFSYQAGLFDCRSQFRNSKTTRGVFNTALLLFPFSSCWISLGAKSLLSHLHLPGRTLPWLASHLGSNLLDDDTVVLLVSTSGAHLATPLVHLDRNDSDHLCQRNFR